ncbi:MAG TPA: S8 family serine peptidase [Candidatus Limnocylindrales bacterium]|nr:S8 family serine peptidase [Candidatus Limnocylindrales bacterium]
MTRRLAALFAALFLATALLPQAAAAASPKPTVSKEDRAAVGRAVANGQATVRVLIAFAPGQGNIVANGIKALGGKVEYREDTVNYLRASVPTGKADAASALAGVKGFELDKVIPVPDVSPDPEGIAGLIPGAPPSAATPRANPYMPTQDTGAAQFVNAHPEWDGRGVTIGIVDTGQSLDNPALLTTSTGERKIIDWVTGTDPFTDNDPTWLNMSTQVTASGGTFVISGTVPGAGTYTAPANGTYRFAIFNERDPRLGGELGSDVNRDGNPAGSSGLFAVLWDTTANNVYVDTNQNKNFSDDMAMTDYRVRYDVNWFGTDNPATAVAERMPFVVQTDGRNKVVNIGIVSGFHGSHVAGIAAGNALFGGQMSGAAPGAKIVSLRACLFIAGCTAHALLEGMIFVAKQSNVDVINMSIGGLPALNDGNNTRCLVYDSLIEQYNVQMFLSQGNDGPGVNTAGDPGVCGKVVGMGAYLTDDTMLADYGQDVNYHDNLHLFSSRGPREDGGFKPSAVAPGAAVSTAPLWQAGAGLPYPLPPGYQLANGTSMASPQAAGVGALLVSAAKATGVQHQPAQIRQSLLSTTRYLTEGNRFQAYDQGVGLLDVAAAWTLLQKQGKTVDISSSVDVHTILNGFLATPGKGQGIYDREGVTKDENYTRTYTFRRTSGPGTTTSYNVSWLGNDGTFSSGGTVSLPKNANVTFDVDVSPSEYGSHSAILRLDDPANPGIEYQTMNTVIVPYDFASPDYSVAISGTIDIAQAQHFFFRVPAGAPAFKVDMDGGSLASGSGQMRFLRWHPFGQGIDSNAVSNCYNPPASAGCASGSPTSRTTTNPQAGVWEVSLDTRRTSDADDAPFTLTATILGASVSPNPDTIATAAVGVPVARSYTLTNLFGAFTGRAVGTSLGSAKIDTKTIADTETQQFTVEVPAGATSLRATIGSPSDPAADLDLFVLRPNGTTGGQSADGDSEESVTIANPVAGTWTIVVDGFSVPAGTTTYKYIDVFQAGSTLGAISATDANALRPAASSWTVPATVTANVVPAVGRVLFGNVQVRTDTNILIGSGDVIVQNVTP